MILETGNGRRLAATSTAFRVGDQVRLVLRPEHLTILARDETGDADVPAIEGRVRETVFVGSTMQVHADIGHGRTALVSHPHTRRGSSDIAPGAEVRIGYSAASGHLIPMRSA